eukprot:GHVH01011265.1.p1 GENE.GHVH01011265.1~~GHVH01011265.1.p1  ORF type:complete len:304 (+),score=34.03 GHVH01011265.1:685-1596(+)
MIGAFSTPLVVPDGMSNYIDEARMARHNEHVTRPSDSVTVPIRSLMCHAPTLPMCMAAIFDGHNGPQASRFLNANYFQVLMQQDELWSLDVITAMKKTFSILESLQVPREGLIESDEWEIADGGSLTPGTTATVCIVIGPKVVIANLGDSRAVLSRAGEFHQLTFDHRPFDLVEKWRLKHENCTAGDTGGGYLNGYLAVSRAMGDYHKISGKKLCGLIADPDFLEFTLHQEDEFILLGCDGIFDMMSVANIGLIVRRHLRSKIPHSLTDFEGAAQAVVDAVKNRGGTDNLTVIVIGIQYMRSK